MDIIHKKLKKIMVMILAVSLFLVGMPLSVMASEMGKEKITPSGITYDSIGDEVDRFIEERKEELAGCSVAVLDGSKTIYKQDYGMMDMENGIAVNEDTVYEWGSISKLLVWVSVMQLYEEGKLDLDRDVEEYLPEGFLSKKKYPEKITMMNLMNHNAGWQETTYGTSVLDPKDIVPLEQALRDLEPCQIFRPGEITAYSNWGAALAGFIVENISGIDYSQYVKENIFEPLEMNHTSIKPDLSDNPWVQKEREKIECYYITKDSKKNLGNAMWYHLLYPEGSVIGTIEDLVKFAKAFTVKDEISPFFKNENTLKTMLSASSYYGKPGGDSGLERNFHGLWGMEYGTQVKGHGGGRPGFTTNFMFDDKTGLAVIVMTNEAPESTFCDGILGLIFGKYVKDEKVSSLLKENISGKYLIMRNYHKTFLKFTSLLFCTSIIKMDEDETYKFSSVGSVGTVSKVDDYIYLFDKGEGSQSIGYLYKNDKGEVYMQNRSADSKKINRISYWFDFVLLLTGILSVFIAMILSLVLIIIYIVRKLKGKKNTDSNKYENIIKWLHRANLFAIVTIGILGYQYMIKPMLYGLEVLIRSEVQWKCIINSVLSIVSIIFSIFLAIYWKRIKAHRKLYVFSALLGLILTFNFWYWEWYNYIC